MKHILTLFAVFLMPLLCFAQKEDYVWVMGYNIIDFNTTPPTVRENKTDYVYSALLNTTVSDKDGNLLYWLNDVNLFNRNNEKIYTVFSVLHSLSIFPFPGSEHKHILMSLDKSRSNILFSIIDGTKDDLHPDIIENYAVLPYKGHGNGAPALIQKQNSHNFWLLYQADEIFYVYALTESGLTLHSTETYDFDYNPNYFYMLEENWYAVSKTQNQLFAYLNGAVGDVLYLLIDFDNANGVIKNIYRQRNVSEYIYPFEFSKNGKYIYFQKYIIDDIDLFNKIYRCPTDKLKESDALNKYQELVYTAPEGHYIYSFKSAPDGNFYFIDSENKESVAVIYNSESENPIVDLNGLKMVNVDKLPLMFPYTYHYPFAVSYTRDCHDFTFSFSESEYESVVWNFGDGTAEVKDVEKPTHTFADDGKYTVSLTVTLTDGIVREYSTDVEITTPKAPRIIVEE